MCVRTSEQSSRIYKSPSSFENERSRAEIMCRGPRLLPQELCPTVRSIFVSHTLVDRLLLFLEPKHGFESWWDL